MMARPYRFRDILPPRLSPQTIADQIKRFNLARFEEFGAAPLPEKPLPIERTGVGGDTTDG
jgi:hypothetical protein